MRAVLLMNDTDLAASLEKYLSDFHNADNVIHVTDVDSARLQLGAEPTEWFVVEPDSIGASYGDAIQELMSNDHLELKRSFVISKDIRWSMFCQTSENADFLKKPFALASLNEAMFTQTGWNERRHKDRVYLKEIVFGEILLDAKTELDIVVHNISTSGCLLHAPARKTGLSIYDSVKLVLPNAEPIVLTCQIVRAQAYQIEVKSGDKFVLLGVRFTSVDADMEMLLADYIHNVLS